MFSPNHSHFVKTLSDRHSVDLEALWQDTMRQKGGYDTRRAFDDKTETRFWYRFSNEYDKNPSLYDYAPQVLDRILAHTGKNKTLVEIGCGTGKFTRPMLPFARHIHAVDFSSHMLAKCSAKFTPKQREKLTLVNSKWEEAKWEEAKRAENREFRADCVYSVNAIYRMRRIRHALAKMDRTAREKVVIVWTMQRSVYDAVISGYFGGSVGAGLERNQEYIHLMALLYELGIDPGLEFIEAVKPVILKEKQVVEDLTALALRHGLPEQELITEFVRRTGCRGSELTYGCPLKVALIYWTPA